MRVSEDEDINLNESNNKLRKIALITSVINFLISILIWIEFDSSTNEYQFVSEFNQLSFCHFNIGIDGISLYFVLLTTFITPIALLSNYSNLPLNRWIFVRKGLSIKDEKREASITSTKYFLISFLLLESLQILTFVVLDLLLFYIFFESVLPVLFIIIVIYGSGEERVRSAFLLFLYTLGGSLAMLLSILVIYSYVGSTDFQLITLSEITLNSQKLLWLSYHLSNGNLTNRGLISHGAQY